MAVPPRVFASGVRVAEVHDIDMHLLTVESWFDRVVVRMVGADTDTARAQLAAYQKALEQDTARWRDGQEYSHPKPPAQQIFEALRVHLDDGMGTTFRWTSGSTGGGGTEFLCEWFFEPALPPEARSLAVTVTTTDGAKSTHVATFADRK